MIYFWHNTKKKPLKKQYKTVNKEMIGGGGGLDQRGNMESLQRDGLAKVKAYDAFRLLVRQNNNIYFCMVSRPTIDLNF